MNFGSVDLPQELIDSIVDALFDGFDLDKDPWIINNTDNGLLRTLRSCALVARAFVRPCQTYLFHGLTIHFVDDDVLVRAILDSFTTVDITLRSLCLYDTPPTSLLKLNAPSIRRLRICVHDSDSVLNEPVDPNVLSDAHRLRSLDLNARLWLSITKMIRLLGSLDHLVGLRTVCITAEASRISGSTYPIEWRGFDRQLSGLPALTEVKVYPRPFQMYPHDPTVLRASMPVLAGRASALDHLVQLRTVCIPVNPAPASGGTDPAEWQELDILLSGLPALAAGNFMYSRYQSFPLDSQGGVWCAYTIIAPLIPSQREFVFSQFKTT
ncbi:hypothetical protein B0H17DRAFT_1211656 [Mycena rosella]|uniref:F-box domain-containing protein n=1 Tax=Mycena rosella TaxID=1033263 RepID=A0AAD7CTW8_MYCRO|nr:hypothetical protein B0H17DRAFT_1211656 [Mycena rosella]